MNLEDEVQKVNSKESFIAFVNVLRDDFIENKDEWVNRTIDRYLHGMAGWIADHDTYTSGKAMNHWQMFASILWAASEYDGKK